MFKLIYVSLAIIALQCNTNKVNALVRLNDMVGWNQKSMPLQSAVSTKPNDDPDYWDAEEYVPYKEPRHDQFDWKLTKAILKDAPSNAIFSPFSIKLLLSILAEAAGQDTSTQKELRSVLPSIMSLLEARELYGRTFGLLLQKSDSYELNLGTKLYIDNFIEPQQRFLATVEKFYSSDTERVNFSNAVQTTEIINKWCSSVTKGHIKQLVTEGDVNGAVMILLNAIYFNGYWRRPFNVTDTVDGTFYKTPTETVKTKFMKRTGNYYYRNSPDLNAQILRIPYLGGKFSFTLILPKENNGLDKVVEKINESVFHAEQLRLESADVRLQLPKFKFDLTSHLNEVLKNLGISSIFTQQASLPLLARGVGYLDRLQVSKILQKAGIDLNEKGSTVYAATEILLENKFGGDTMVDVIANRPFMFVIEDESSGTVLFTGKVTNPAL